MIRVVRTDFSDSTLERWWKEKYQQGALVTDTAFQSWNWNYCWWKHFIEPDPMRELLLLKALEGDNIVAVAPWFIQKRTVGGYRLWNYVLWIADRLSAYPDLVLATGNEQNVWESFLKFCLTQYGDIWFIFNDMHPRSSIINFCPGGYECNKKPSDTSFSLNFMKFSAGIESLHPNLRRGLKKALRAYHSSDGWDWEIHVPSSSQDLETLKKLCKDRFGSKCFFQVNKNTVFFDDFSKRNEAETFCSVLLKEGNITSIVMGFIHQDVFYYFLSGMDSDFKEGRPGLLNLYLLIEYAKNNEYRAFDFLKGEERYKKEFRASREELCQYFIIPENSGMRIKLYSLAQRIKNIHQRIHSYHCV